MNSLKQMKRFGSTDAEQVFGRPRPANGLRRMAQRLRRWIMARDPKRRALA